MREHRSKSEVAQASFSARRRRARLSWERRSPDRRCCSFLQPRERLKQAKPRVASLKSQICDFRLQGATRGTSRQESAPAPLASPPVGSLRVRTTGAANCRPSPGRRVVDRGQVVPVATAKVLAPADSGGITGETCFEAITVALLAEFGSPLGPPRVSGMAGARARQRASRRRASPPWERQSPDRRCCSFLQPRERLKQANQLGRARDRKGNGCFMTKIRDFLKGKKTYITAAIGLIGAIVAWSDGQIDMAGLIAAAWAAAQTCFIRAGVATEARKAEEV
jgi:hypothetical protein